MTGIKSRIYTLLITISNRNISFEGIKGDLQDCAYIQDIELIESVDNKYKVQVEIDSDIDLNNLCLYIEHEWGSKCRTY